MTEPEKFRQQFAQHHSKEQADAHQEMILAHMTRLIAMLPKPIHALEIGCFKGGMTTWMLTHGVERVTVIDTFEGSPEHQGIVKPGDIRALFDAAMVPFAGRVAVSKGLSHERLAMLLTQPKKGQKEKTRYDFIYVDGSHDSADVILDAFLAWKLLKPGGVMGFDDVGWNFYEEEYRNPKPAVLFFINCLAHEMEVIEAGYQLSVRKRA